MKKIVIIGATSRIALAVARVFAQEGATLVVAGRNKEALNRVSEDLKVRGALGVKAITFEAEQPDQHAVMCQQAMEFLGSIDAVLIAHGTLPDQEICSHSWRETKKSLVVNLDSPIACLTWFAQYFEAKGSGHIAAISSVAGERGREKNYVYGSAKAALTEYLSGLRSRLSKKGIKVTTIIPGFVDTPMTAHLKKGPLFANPDDVGARIVTAMKRGEDVVYVPWYWRFIMLIIKMIPEGIFKRLSI